MLDFLDIGSFRIERSQLAAAAAFIQYATERCGTSLATACVSCTTDGMARLWRNAAMTVPCEQLLLDLDYAVQPEPAAWSASLRTVPPAFAEQHDDPAQAEELERQQDA
jgi:hypothetical protein